MYLTIKSTGSITSLSKSLKVSTTIFLNGFILTFKQLEVLGIIQIVCNFGVTKCTPANYM